MFDVASRNIFLLQEKKYCPEKKILCPKEKSCLEKKILLLEKKLSCHYSRTTTRSNFSIPTRLKAVVVIFGHLLVNAAIAWFKNCLLYTSPSPRD